MSGAREALLGQVIAYYAAHGVRDTSLRTLAAEIGTSQRMLHYHFGSREDLLAAVIDAIAGGQAAAIAQLFEEVDDPLEAGLRNWHETAEGALQLGALWFELATHAMHGRPHAAGLAEVMVAGQLRAFTEVFAAHTDRDHAARLARLTLAVGQGLLFDLLLDGDRPAADAAIEEFTAMVRHQLRPGGD